MEHKKKIKGMKIFSFLLKLRCAECIRCGRIGQPIYTWFIFNSVEDFNIASDRIIYEAIRRKWKFVHDEWLCPFCLHQIGEYEDGNVS